MAIHPADKRANNPRLQCACCAKWMRLSGVRKNANGEPEHFYRFYGGCGYTNGDHLAGKGGNDVCDECCHRECSRLAALTAAQGGE